MIISLESPDREETVEVSTRYSTSSLILGPILPLIRKDYRGFWVQTLLVITTLGIGWIIIPNFYNQRYIGRLIEKGYAIKNCGEKEHILINISKGMREKS